MIPPPGVPFAASKPGEKETRPSITHVYAVEAAPADETRLAKPRMSVDQCSLPPRASDLSAPEATRSPFETDIEAMITPMASMSGASGSDRTMVGSAGGNGGDTYGGDDANGGKKHKRNLTCGNKLGVTTEVWPGQSFWKDKAREKKKQRSCTCLSKLSKGRRMMAKIIIGLLVIGIAVGVGLGISKPLGAAIWSPHTNRNNS